MNYEKVFTWSHPKLLHFLQSACFGTGLQVEKASPRGGHQGLVLTQITGIKSYQVCTHRQGQTN